MKKFKALAAKQKINGKLLTDSLVIYEGKSQVFILLAIKSANSFKVCWSQGTYKENPSNRLEELYEVKTDSEALKIVKGLERLADALFMDEADIQVFDENESLFFEQVKKATT